MYVPAAFKEDRQDELLEIMRQCTLPVLVSPARDATGLHLNATHLPLLISKERLVGHIAKANMQWKQLDTAMESLAIFKTVDGYISPTHYATKQETGKVVPTWNYEAVHAYGRLEIIEDSMKILQIVTSLTDHYEKDRAKPWHVSDAPADYIEAQLKGIVGVVLHVTRLEGSRKLSQNKSAADQQGVIAGQQTENPALARQMILAAKGGK
jgi:transcriptional regulator